MMSELDELEQFIDSSLPGTRSDAEQATFDCP